MGIEVTLRIPVEQLKEFLAGKEVEQHCDHDLRFFLVTLDVLDFTQNEGSPTKVKLNRPYNNEPKIS